jgi:hypothetical protein
VPPSQTLRTSACSRSGAAMQCHGAGPGPWAEPRVALYRAIALRRAMVLYHSPIDSLSAIIGGICHHTQPWHRTGCWASVGKVFGPGRRRALWAGPHAPSLRLVCARRSGCRICTVLNCTGNLNLCGKVFETCRCVASLKLAVVWQLEVLNLCGKVFDTQALTSM